VTEKFLSSGAIFPKVLTFAAVVLRSLKLCFIRAVVLY